MSRGGVRLVVEDPLEVDAVYELVIGDTPEASPRQGKVVWVRDEADGQICGIAFLDSDEGAPPPAASDPSAAQEP